MDGGLTHHWSGLAQKSELGKESCESCLSLQVYAFDATRPSRNKTNGILGMYESASCRIALDLHLVSPPPNVTVSSAQLSPSAQSQQSPGWQHRRATAIVVPSVVGGFLAIILLGCLALGLAKKSSEAVSKH